MLLCFWFGLKEAVLINTPEDTGRAWLRPVTCKFVRVDAAEPNGHSFFHVRKQNRQRVFGE